MILDLDRRGRIELAVLSILMLTTTLAFWFTDLDIRAAALFYHPENPEDPWPERHFWLWKLLFDYATPFTVAGGGLAIGIFALGWLHASARRFRRSAIYVLLVILVGPGLVVNLIVKDHWGRPRPVHVTAFRGEHQYIPPLQLGHTPDKSFVCGHCSVGYSFFALYFLARHHKLFYFLLTITLAWVMGFTRMTSGGHFLSDILWSGYLVFLVAFLLYYGWYRRRQDRAA